MSTFFRETRAPAIDHVSAAVINAGGTGHAVNDIITMLLGPGGVGTACQIRVLTVSAGVITSISVEDSGSYTTQPSPTTNIGQASTTGSGVGFTADLTFTAERVDIMTVKMIMDAITAGRILTVAVGAGGSGYLVGDEITLADPGDVVIDTFEARFEVTSVAAGVVDGIRMVSCGAYTTVFDMSGAAVATTGGTGTGLTVSLTVEGPYTAVPTSGAAGSGFVVGEVVTVNEGTLHAGASHHQFVVTTVSAGAIVDLEPLRVGRYDVQPTNPVAITADLSGTGATIDLTVNSWRLEGSIAENFTDGITKDFAFLTVGANLSGDNPVIGCKVLDVTANDQIGVLCATSYDNGQTFENQPGTSPASQFLAPDTDGHPRIPSAASGTFTLFLSISGRRLVWTSFTSPARETCYQGLFTPFIDSPATKYPSPLFIGSCTDDSAVDITDPYNISSPHATWMRQVANPANGKDFVRDPLGGWRPIQVDTGPDGWKFWPIGGRWGNVVEAPNIETGSGTITPPAPMSEAVLDDDTASSPNWFNQSILANGPAPSPFGVGGNDLYWLSPQEIVRDETGALELYGELEGIFYLHGNGLAAGDRIQDADGNIYTCQIEPNSAENRHFYAVRESG